MALIQLDAPNLLTLSRLGLAALVWVAPGSPGWVLSVMAVAGFTDVLDGWAARTLEAEGKRRRSEGAWLDPLCDKVFVLSSLAAVWTARQPPWVVLPLVATRELLQAPLVLAYHLVPALRRHGRYEFRAALLGKATTVFQFLAVAAILFAHPLTYAFALLAALSGALAVAVYVVRARRLLQGEPAEPAWPREKVPAGAPEEPWRNARQR